MKCVGLQRTWVSKRTVWWNTTTKRLSWILQINVCPEWLYGRAFRPSKIIPFILLCFGKITLLLACSIRSVWVAFRCTAFRKWPPCCLVTRTLLHANSNHPNVHKMACIRTLFELSFTAPLQMRIIDANFFFSKHMLYSVNMLRNFQRRKCCKEITE